MTLAPSPKKKKARKREKNNNVHTEEDADILYRAPAGTAEVLMIQSKQTGHVCVRVCVV